MTRPASPLPLDPDARAADALADARRGAAPGELPAPHPDLEERGHPQPGPLHSPHVCKSCSAPIFWAAVLDERGQRVKNPDTGRPRAIPVNAQPDPDGRVVLLHRGRGEGIVAHILRRGERPAPGERLRSQHLCRRRA